MDKQTKQAIEHSAQHCCDLLNASIGPLFKEKLTPETLVYQLMLTDEEFPDWTSTETLGTVRGLGQRLSGLQHAVQGRPSHHWLKHWSKKAASPIQTIHAERSLDKEKEEEAL